MRGSSQDGSSGYCLTAVETNEIPAPGEAWASTRLLARLGADTGSFISVGKASFRVTKVLDFRPDQGWQFVDLAPTLLINMADLESTALIQPGSRVSYRNLFAGPRDDIASFKPQLEALLTAGEQLRDIEDTDPQMRSAMDRSGRFLNLASLVSVLLAAVAVAMAARRYAIRHRDRIALLKCLGSQQAFILRLNLLQLFMLTLLGAAVGIVLGYCGTAGTGVDCQRPDRPGTAGGRSCAYPARPGDGPVHTVRLRPARPDPDG